MRLVIVCLGFLIWMVAYVGYMRFFYSPPDPVPCTEGMTLQPGQTCFFFIETDPPRREKL